MDNIARQGYDPRTIEHILFQTIERISTDKERYIALFIKLKESLIHDYWNIVFNLVVNGKLLTRGRIDNAEFLRPLVEYFIANRIDPLTGAPFNLRMFYPNAMRRVSLTDETRRLLRPGDLIVINDINEGNPVRVTRVGRDGNMVYVDFLERNSLRPDNAFLRDAAYKYVNANYDDTRESARAAAAAGGGSYSRKTKKRKTRKTRTH